MTATATSGSLTGTGLHLSFGRSHVLDECDDAARGAVDGDRTV